MAYKLFSFFVRGAFLCLLIVLFYPSLAFGQRSISFNAVVPYESNNDGLLADYNVSITVYAPKGGDKQPTSLIKVNYAKFKALVYNGVRYNASQLTPTLLNHCLSVVDFNRSSNDAAVEYAIYNGNVKEWEGSGYPRCIDDACNKWPVMFEKGSPSIRDVKVTIPMVGALNRTLIREQLFPAKKKEEDKSAQALGVSKGKVTEVVVTNPNSNSSGSGNSSTTDGSTQSGVSIQSSSNKNNTPADRALTKEQVVEETTQKLKAIDDNYWASIKESNERSEQFGKSVASSFYAAQATQDARNGMADLSHLSGSYESLEQLNKAFIDQYNAIDQQKEALVASSIESNQAFVDVMWQPTDAGGEAMKSLTVGIGNLISDANSEKDAKAAREKLKTERDKLAKEIEDRQWQKVVSMRKELLKKFPDGGVPLSFHKVEGNELYFFSYVMDPASVGMKTPVAYVSNVFPIGRFSDGAWPFKSAIVSEVRKISGGQGNVILMGYYTSANNANSMRNAFLSIAAKCGIDTQGFSYKGKKSATRSVNNADFWEKEKSAPKQTEKKDDFWNGSSNKPTMQNTDKPAQEKKDDFWK